VLLWWLFVVPFVDDFAACGCLWCNGAVGYVLRVAVVTFRCCLRCAVVAVALFCCCCCFFAWFNVALPALFAFRWISAVDLSPLLEHGVVAVLCLFVVIVTRYVCCLPFRSAIRHCRVTLYVVTVVIVGLRLSLGLFTVVVPLCLRSTVRSFVAVCCPITLYLDVVVVAGTLFVIHTLPVTVCCYIPVVTLLLTLRVVDCGIVR